MRSPAFATTAPYIAPSMGEPFEPFDLRVVPLGAVVPHEEAEDQRVERLVDRLADDGRLTNPPVVAAVDDHFVLLDGATRLAAMRRLGFDRMIVQVAGGDGLRLETWSHVILDIEPDLLLGLLGAVDAVRLDPADPGASAEGDDVMCVVRLVDGRSFAVHPAAGQHPFRALNPFVAAYLDATTIARRIATDLDAVVGDRPGTAALVTFPRLTVDAVFTAARDGHRLPAGITRFIVAGRVIDLNAPLASLREGRPLDADNRWLHDLVAERRLAGRIRHYPEAVYVLDD
jgi:hypothetical protein